MPFAGDQRLQLPTMVEEASVVKILCLNRINLFAQSRYSTDTQLT